MVMPNWNPHGPGKLGIELVDVGYGHQVIDASSDVGVLREQAQRTGEVDSVDLHTGAGASAPALGSAYNSLPRPMLLELMAAGQEAWGALTYNDYGVTAVTGVAGMFNENLTTPINANRLNAFDDGLYLVSSKLNAYFDAQFNTGAFGLDRHVLAVEVQFRGNITLGVRRFDTFTTSVWSRDFPFWTNGWASGAMRFGEVITEAGASTWRHWTPQMVRDFASGGTRKIRITCRGGPGAWKLDRLYLRVFSIPERRRGVGIGSPTGPFLWIPFTMQTPNATGSPSITSGEQLTWMARRPIDQSVDNVSTAVMPWRYLRGVGPDGGWRQHSIPFNPAINTGNNGKSGLMGAIGPAGDGILTMRTVDAATVQADSMPYSLSRGALVYAGQNASQFLTAAGGGTIYGQAYVVAGWKPSTGKPAGPLRVELWRVSTGLRVFDAVEISADDVDRLPVSAPVNNVDDETVTYKTLVLRFAGSSALAAAQYELRMSAPAAASGVPWHIAALMADNHTTDQTFGGATDFAQGKFMLNGVLTDLTSGGVRSSDLLAQLVEVPGPVTGVATAVGSLTAHHAEVCDPNAGCQGCADDTMPFAQVTWSPAASGNPDVAGYQIDRMDDLSPDWERVASVAGRLSNVWNDHEARIGVRSQYRARVLRTDGVTGDWSDTVSVTLPPGQIALAFSSNAATGMGCVYPEVWQGEVVRQWDFEEADDVTLRRMYGRNGQVAFRPIERAGDAWSRQVLLDAFCSVTPPSMAVFQPLRDLAWAPIPYVCVRDGEGNRWFASLRVPNGVNRRADAAGTELWLTNITVATATDVPAVHDTSVAQVTEPAQVAQL